LYELKIDVEDLLKLSNQVCFPIYSLSREIINMYRPLLAKLDLTYPQYLVMMVLWEKNFLNIGQIGQQLHLDTGTLTPLLKRLEGKELIIRQRSSIDERIVEIFLTEKGKALQATATCVPLQMLDTINLSTDEILQLRQIINKILNTIY